MIIWTRNMIRKLENLPSNLARETFICLQPRLLVAIHTTWTNKCKTTLTLKKKITMKKTYLVYRCRPFGIPARKIISYALPTRETICIPYISSLDRDAMPPGLAASRGGRGTMPARGELQRPRPRPLRVRTATSWTHIHFEQKHHIS